MNARALRLLTALFLAMLLAACTEGGGSIYYTLEHETKTVDLTLPNAITVFDVTKLGASYYTAAGRMWAGAISGTSVTWDTDHPVAPPNEGDLCTALVAFPFDTLLYGGFIYPSGNRGLFQSTAAPSFSGGTKITDADVLDHQIALLKAETVGVTPTLVAVTAKQPSAGENFEYQVVTSINGSNFGVLFTPPVGEEEKPINDVIYSNTLGTWFATQGTNLYSGAGPLVLADMTGITAGEVLRGLFDDGTHVFLASKAGAVYYWDNVATWKRIPVPTVSGAHPPLTNWAGPVGATILLVGSNGYGYYRLDTADLGGADPLTRFPTTTIDLHAALVMKLFLDGAEDRVFACTSMAGLWRGAVAGDGSITWSLE